MTSTVMQCPEDAFAADVTVGLTATRKSIPPKYFYDTLGSRLFEAICSLPEYYLTRCEASILERYSTDILGHCDSDICIVELGSGSSVKTRYLLNAASQTEFRTSYCPVDISEAILNETCRQLGSDFPSIDTRGIVADYTTGLEMIRRPGNARLLVLFLGSNIGNYDPTQAKELLTAIRARLLPGDYLLLGADLKKSSEVLNAAYDDPVGVTAAFNRNLLRRINVQFEANFDLRAFAHKAFYNGDKGRVEMHLVSRKKQTVDLKKLELTVQFAEGESIHTENSWKFDMDQLSGLAKAAGYSRVTSWFDKNGYFSTNLWAAA